MRYSHTGFGGSARFVSMGGAFGAVGADVTVGAYNPAGLGVYRKGEISFGAGFKATSNVGEMYKTVSSVFDLNPTFNNFGFTLAFNAASDQDSRNVIGFSNTQTQNFNNSTRMSGYTNSSSIAKDMLNEAEQNKSKGVDITKNLIYGYEGLAFNTLLLDTVNGKFFSMLDVKRTVKQTRDIKTSGRVNDLNFSYAYAYKDKFYFGASLGVPQVKYESTITHTEADNLDSMQIKLINDSTFSHTYVDDIPILRSYYDDKLGFNSLDYTEYFKTTGSGINLKLGAIIRVNDLLRVGMYYHTPTLYRFKDTYYNSLSVSYDANPKNPEVLQDPELGGIFNYRIITPGKVSANVAFIIQKLAVLAVDYEFVNYKSARLVSDDISDFENANSVIKSSYKGGHNVRVGGELNLNPVMLRLGYNMQGSPFGKAFVGDYVRNTFSGGIGYRTQKKFYFDLVVYHTLSSENYYLFSTLDTQARLNYSSTSFAATIGFKF